MVSPRPGTAAPSAEGGANAIAPDRAPSGKRLLWVDTIKGIAIILVVLGHANRGLITAQHAGGDVGNSTSTNYGFLDRWIYAFHMATFFFIAGVFALRSLRRGPWAMLAGKVATILYPYAIWTVLQFEIHEHIAHATNSASAHYWLPYLLFRPYEEFWFLYVLFMMFAIVAVLAAMKLNRWAVLGVALALFLVAQRVFLVWVPLQQTCEYMIYFAVGTVLADHLIQTAQRLNRMAAVGLAVAGFSLMTLAVRAGWDNRDFLREVPAFSGISATFCLALALRGFVLERWAAFLGALSLEIYVVHTIAVALVRSALMHTLHVHSYAINLVAGVTAGILVPVALAMLCRWLRFPYLFVWPRRSDAHLPTPPALVAT